jgi:hypothetical protein
MTTKSIAIDWESVACCAEARYKEAKRMEAATGEKTKYGILWNSYSELAFQELQTCLMARYRAWGR